MVFNKRDILHINDFCLLIEKQIKKFKVIKNKSFTVGGGSKILHLFVKFSKFVIKLLEINQKFKKSEYIYL